MGGWCGCTDWVITIETECGAYESEAAEKLVFRLECPDLVLVDCGLWGVNGSRKEELVVRNMLGRLEAAMIGVAATRGATFLKPVGLFTRFVWVWFWARKPALPEAFGEASSSSVSSASSSVTSLSARIEWFFLACFVKVVFLQKLDSENPFSTEGDKRKKSIVRLEVMAFTFSHTCRWGSYTASFRCEFAYVVLN